MFNLVGVHRDYVIRMGYTFRICPVCGLELAVKPGPGYLPWHFKRRPDTKDLVAFEYMDEMDDDLVCLGTSMPIGDPS
jgi:hypothetical protein